MKFLSFSKKFTISFLLIIAAVLIHSGCGGKVTRSEYSRRPVMDQAQERMVEEKAAPYYSRRDSKQSFQKKESVVIDEIKPSEGDDLPKTSRMIHYNGYLKLRVVRLNDALKSASEIVKKYGGYVEYLRDRSASFRVPVKNFKRAFNQIKKLGDILSRSITAEDITDAYSDTELRLKVAEETRDRYIELLKRTKDEKEKIRLLKEIQRLNEKIERMRDSLQMLASLASYSRISLDLVPRQELSGNFKKDDKAGFRWIYQLSPFTKTVAAKGEVVELKVPEGMVRLPNKRYFFAESANGVTLLSYKRFLNPRGDTDFWVKAVKSRVEKEFASADIIKTEGYSLLKLKSLYEKPYIYIVGFRAVLNQIHMIEIYFPNEELEKRYFKSIIESLKDSNKKGSE